ncbi:MAG: caspase domain-containing protein [Candidatus Hermodarchaeota archaeon]
MKKRLSIKKIVGLGAIVLFLVLVVGVSTPAQGVAPPPRYAVIVGINDYKFGLDLKYPVNDATDWKNYLLSKNFMIENIHVVLDSQATSSRIRSELSWLRSKATANAEIAFIFAGHGGYTKLCGSIIIPHDSKSNTYGISMVELRSIFAGAVSSKMLFYFDACESGNMTSLDGPGRIVLTACKTDELSYESPVADLTEPFYNGAFTYHMMDYLNYYANVEDAYSYARTETWKWANSNNLNQTPQMADGDTGKYCIGSWSSISFDDFDDKQWQSVWTDRPLSSSGINQIFQEGLINTGYWENQTVLSMHESGTANAVGYYAVYCDLGSGFANELTLEAVTGIYQPSTGEIAYVFLAIWDVNWDRIAAGGTWDSWSSTAKKDYAHIESSTYVSPYHWDPNRADGVKIHCYPNHQGGFSLTVYLDTDQDGTFTEYSEVLSGSSSKTPRYIGFYFAQHHIYKNPDHYPWVDNFRFIESTP